jgi:ATP-binding cassette subfamily B protein
MKLPIWPVARLEEGLDRLSGRSSVAATFGEIAASIESPRDVQTWLYAAATARGLEAEPLRVHGMELETALRGSAPAIIVVLDGVLIVRRVRRRTSTLVSLGGDDVEVPTSDVLAAMRNLWERRYGLRSVDALLESASVPPGRRARTRRFFLRQQLAGIAVDAGWSVRLAVHAPVAAQFGASRQWKDLARALGTFAASEASFVIAWVLLGRGVLAGELDRGWLLASGLALVTAAVTQVLSNFWQATTVVTLGAILKRRLLMGVLRLDPSYARRHGLGQSMGQVLEADAVEDLSLAGGFQSVLATVEFAVAAAIIATASWLLFAIVATVCVVTLLVCVAYYRRAKDWSAVRMRMSHEFIERLVGHRTRLVQQHARAWHADEDMVLDEYGSASRSYDSLVAAASALLPRMATLCGVLGLGVLFVTGARETSLWIGLGGVLLAQHALGRLSAGLTALIGAKIAWSNAEPLFEAAKLREEPPTAEGLRASLRRATPGETLLTAKNVEFRFEPTRAPVLTAVDFALTTGDHVLLEGLSGSGKSTFTSMLAGLRRPTGGLLLFGGLDAPTLGGAVWRKRVATAPQQHDNHVLNGSLAFNLLLGRDWPPTERDLDDARRVCDELGLGDLLRRMPSGLMQSVGSSGWRLSQGEASRVFIARALLQKADVVVLDESFAALDPVTMTTAIECARRRANTLVVVAHP